MTLGTPLAAGEDMRLARQIIVLAVAFLATFLATCASTSKERRLWSEDSRPALLHHDTALQIWVRNGRVEAVVPPSAPGEPVRVRTIDDIEELRRIYAAADKPLPVRTGAQTVEVNGWVGLECVRAGNACGPPPAEPLPIGIILRFE